MALLEIRHIHIIRFESSEADNKLLTRVIQEFNSLNIKIDRFMALTEQQFTEVFDAVNQATNQAADYATAIGLKIDRLEEEIRNAGLPAEAEERILARATAIKDNTVALSEALRAMSADETNPVPVPVPGEEPTNP